MVVNNVDESHGIKKYKKQKKNKNKIQVVAPLQGEPLQTL